MSEESNFIIKPSWLSFSPPFQHESRDNKTLDNYASSFLGLFANKDFDENEEIGIYHGDILKTLEAMKLKDKSYLMRLGEQCYINSGENHLSCEMRYINDCRNLAGYNVMFLKCPELYVAKVISLRPIKRFEEIFVSYGKWYWLGSKIVPVRLTFRQLYDLKATYCEIEQSEVEVIHSLS